MIDIEETNIGVHALLITSDGKIILQQRDNNPEIVNSGMISIFGGTIRSEDDLIQGLKRELMEELELDISDLTLTKLDTFYKIKELDGVDWEVNVFVIKNVDLKNLKLHEGRGFVCDFSENLLKKEKLTRITRLALERYSSLLE